MTGLILIVVIVVVFLFKLEIKMLIHYLTEWGKEKCSKEPPRIVHLCDGSVFIEREESSFPDGCTDDPPEEWLSKQSGVFTVRMGNTDKEGGF